MKKKIIILIAFVLILLAGIVITGLTLYKSNSHQEIVYEMGSVKIEYAGGEQLDFKGLDKGNVIYGKTNGTNKDGALFSINNLSTVPVKITVTLELYDIDGSIITGERKDLIESMLMNSSLETRKAKPIYPYVKDTAFSTGNLLVYKASFTTKGNKDLFYELEYRDDLTAKELELIGNFKIVISALAEQYIEGDAYQFISSNNQSIAPGSYTDVLGQVSVKDSNNKYGRPVIVRQKIAGRISYTNTKGTVVTEDISFSDERISLDINERWVKYGDYYYYKGVLNNNEATSPMIDKVVFSSSIGNIYQDSRVTILFDSEVIDSDPEVRPNDWLTDEELGITSNPGVINMTINNCPTKVINVKDKFSIDVVTTPNNLKKDYEITSSNYAVASVNKNEIEALSTGTAVITVKSLNGHTATCNVFVSKDASKLRTISFDKPNISINIGAANTLNVISNIGESTINDVIWKVQNPKVAALDISDDTHSAKVFGLKSGKTDVIATVEGVSTTATITVLDTNEKVDSVTLFSKAYNMSVGEMKQIGYSVSPTNTNYKTKYFSDNSFVATVDSRGVVTAKAVGDAKIYVANGNKSNVIYISVTDINNTNPVNGISTNVDSINMDINERVNIKTVIECKDINSPCTDKVIYTSSNTDVVVADSSKGAIMAKKAGSAIVTVKAGDVTKQIAVVVTNNDNIKSKSIKFEKDFGLAIGQSRKLSYTLDGDKNVRFLSSDSTIATVDNKGNVKAIGEGVAYISVASGEESDYIAITVYEKAKKVEINQYYKRISLDQDITLNAIVSPISAKKRLKWTSSNTDVIIIDSATGRIVPVGVGTSIITASVDNIYSQVKIEVTDSKKPVNSIALSDSSISLSVGEVKQIKTIVTPSNDVKYISLDSSIASVEVDGTIMGVNPGVVDIYAVSSGNVSKVSVNVTGVEKVSLNGNNRNWVRNSIIQTTDDEVLFYTGISIISFSLVLIVFFIIKIARKKKLSLLEDDWY